MAAAITVVVVVTLGFLVVRIATSALVLTGMGRESARFQARSAFLGVGFTTREAEMIVRHPVRRRIAMWLMWLGNAGVVGVVGSLIISLGGGRFTADRVAVIAGGVLAVLLIARSALIERAMARVIEPVLCRVSNVNTQDYAALLHVAGGYSVAELNVQPHDWLAGRTLDELKLRDEGFAVLGIERLDGRYTGVPRGGDRIDPGETLVVYGEQRRIRELDDRPAGPDGDRAHALAVSEARARTTGRPGAGTSRTPARTGAAAR